MLPEKVRMYKKYIKRPFQARLP